MESYDIHVGKRRELPPHVESMIPMITALSRVNENDVREVMFALESMHDIMEKMMG